MLRALISTLVGLVVAGSARAQAADRWNVLLITVDDMSCDSVGAFGCPLPGATPNIDRLAASGRRFTRAHVNIAICQPTRAVWLTGRYPHRSGALGFDPIRAEVPTLVEALHDAGWRTGLLGKTRHVVPTRHAAFDTIVSGEELEEGRSPARYAERAAEFFAAARAADQPFFLMANAHDPHRPFAGSAQEARQNRNAARPRAGRPRFASSRPICEPSDVPRPPFLPDLPPVRLELVEYFTSVHRADATVGALLDALDASGAAGRTIVMFLSDHGMPLPFSKTNCWQESTRTPWIVRWPSITAAGSVDAEHFVSGIDLAPTLLDALGLEPLAGADGRSFLPLLHGGKQEGRDHVVTCIHTTSAKRAYPMRAVHTAAYSYIWNPWSDGAVEFRNESQSGRTFRAMLAAAADDPQIAARVALFVRRVPHELYRHEDRHSLTNLVDEPAHREPLTELQALLLGELAATGDPLHDRFAEFLGR